MTEEGPGAGRPLTDEFLKEDSGDVLVAISASFACLTTLAIVSRFYAKRFSAPKMAVDDMFMTAAYVVNLAMCTLGIVMTKVGGVGKHVQAVKAQDPALLVGWAKCILAFEMVYFTSVALPKTAVLCLYLRIFNWKGAMRVATLTLMGLTIATSLSLLMAACFQCRPLAYWWDRSLPGGSCFDIQTFFHAQAMPGFVLDSVIMVLPVRTIWGLNLPVIKRIALVVVFAVASFGMVASIVRATIFFNTAALNDRTRASVELVGWSIIETSTYIVAACLPSLKPIVSHYAPQWLKNHVRQVLSKATIATLSATGGTASRSRSRKDRRDTAYGDMQKLDDALRRHTHTHTPTHTHMHPCPAPHPPHAPYAPHAPHPPVNAKTSWLDEGSERHESREPSFVESGQAHYDPRPCGDSLPATGAGDRDREPKPTWDYRTWEGREIDVKNEVTVERGWPMV